MQKISQKSLSYLDKILKHYPMLAEQEKENKQTPQKQKYPQQHMHDYRKERQIYDRPTSQKLDNMKFFKEEGNNHYKNQRYKEATYFYQKTIIYGDYTFPDNPQDTNTMDELLQQANCNLGLTLIKVEEWESARVNLIQGSKGNNLKIKAKALYWLAKYYIKVNKDEKVHETITQIEQMGQPFNQCTMELQNCLKNTNTSNEDKQKKVCSNMFSS